MDITTTIIGAGVVGLAVAAEISAVGKGVVILERNPSFGQETSSRNSEVIHAGIYYAKDSLKWAAMTYVVAALSSAAMLLYFILSYFGRD